MQRCAIATRRVLVITMGEIKKVQPSPLVEVGFDLELTPLIRQVGSPVMAIANLKVELLIFFSIDPFFKNLQI